MDFDAPCSSSSSSSPDAASTPRTPSPPSAEFSPPINFKHPIESLPAIFQESESYFHSDPHMIQNEAWPQYNGYNNSLLQELYEPDLPNDVYIDDHAHYNEWQQQQQQQQQHHHHHMHVRQTSTDHTVVRRATYPYVRHDQLPHQYPHFYDQYPSMYSEPLPMTPDPAEHHPHLAHDPQPIKLEDTPLIVPSQLGFPSHSLHPHHPSFLPPAVPGAVPVQHTDDAASKETQYLRRRCFNCHTTEPPSWRRSTLNPGKIVCNKCGLYERTHLRPRPLRFDELRAGGKTRKTGPQADKKAPKVPVPAVVGSPQVKKEPREFALVRRGSVSSNASSGGGVSDWDDNVSVYSSQPPTPGSTSGQSSSFSSPAVGTYPIPRSSQSPPVDSGAQGPIRLPNAPLTDIASLQRQQPHPPPRKSATAPSYYPQPAMYQGQETFRRGSLPVPRNVPFASPPMPSQSPAPMQALASDAPLLASPQVLSSPQLQPSPSLLPESLSS
ncbi:hypothetical protein F5I97DRAFT_1804663 [Phlebopus sp. FC_14]|nr:hypothetical protein F5I97DRAFT_1804663 [Phlebopus sp. FC_14]